MRDAMRLVHLSARVKDAFKVDQLRRALPVAARLMRELMLRAVSGAPIEEVGECCKERDSPVTVFTDFY